MDPAAVECEFDTEPRGRIYAQLLNYAHHRCDTVSLVVRFDLGLSLAGHKFLISARELIQRVDIVSSWPGTELVDQVAVIIYLPFTKSTLDLILSYSSRLYEWVQPHLPEDLCVYRDSTPWLISVAHEQLSWLRVYPAELEELFSAITELRSFIRVKP